MDFFKSLCALPEKYDAVTHFVPLDGHVAQLLLGLGNSALLRPCSASNFVTKNRTFHVLPATPSRSWVENLCPIPRASSAQVFALRDLLE